MLFFWCRLVVFFSGSNQNIGGAAQTIFNNLTISSGSTTSTVTVGQAVARILLCDGVLNAGGNLTLLSTPAGTALIDGSGSGTITGNVTMQRYLPSQFGYKYFSSPFASATVNEFAYEINLNASFSRFYKYDESRTSSGWVSYAKKDSILHPLHGYAANFGDTVSAKTVSVTGVVNNGTISRTLYNHNYPYTLGFSLAGNPYPSPIDWDAATGWTRDKIDDAIYYFSASTIDEYSGTYISYVNGIPSDGSPSRNIIPSMQGFFVHVTDGDYPVRGVLEMDNSVRITDQTHQFTKSEDKGSSQVLRVSATFIDDTRGIKDFTAVYFNEKAVGKFDSRLDALKLMNTDLFAPNLYAFSSDGYKLSVHALPFISDSLTIIPLGLKTARSGLISFRITSMENLSDISQVFLRDDATGNEYLISRDRTYNVPLTAGEYKNRFSLRLIRAITDIKVDESQDSFEIYSSKGVLITNIRELAGEKGILLISDLSGRIVFHTDIYDTGYYEFSPDLINGIYIVNFITGKKQEAKKIFILHK